VRVVLEGATRTIDAGRLTYRSWAGEEETAHFVNAASAGMSGAVAQRANASSKALGGKVSFLWATLAVFAGWHASEMEIEVDGERRSGLMYDAIVANCRYLGGGMAMCPDARPDDGLLDLLVIGDITRRDLALTLPKVYRGTHLPHPKAEALRARHIAVRAPTPLPVELDGEQPGTTPAVFEVVPDALRLRVPA
jgi:diacylglycerol kinase family enzyme